MKILSKMLFLVFLAIALVACSDSDEASKEKDTTKEESTTNEDPATNDEAANQENTEEPTGTANEDVTEIFAALEAAQEDINSQSSKFDMVMEAVGGPDAGKMEFHFETDQILETGEHHMKGNMVIAGAGENMDMDMEIYQTIDAVYTSSSLFGGGWMVDTAGASEPFTISTTESLQSLGDLANQFKVAEKDGKLVLSIDAGTLESSDFFLQSGMLGETGIDASVDYNVKLNKFEYVINPDSMLLEQMTYDVELSGTDPEQGEVSLTMLLDFVVTDYNHIDAITVPQEVLDAAMDMNSIGTEAQ